MLLTTGLFILFYFSLIICSTALTHVYKTPLLLDRPAHQTPSLPCNWQYSPFHLNWEAVIWLG